MPVIINNSTGLAENLSANEAKSALESGSHSLPFMDPQGNPVSIQYNETSQAVKNNYRQPDEKELDALMRNAAASSTEGQLKAGVTGFLKGATLGLSPVLQVKTGISTEQELKDLAEANPGITAASEMGGLIATSVLAPEAGAAAAMSRAGKAGEMLAAAAGATEATAMGRAALTAGRMAAETALYQAGDEISKQIIYEPEKSVAQSVVDVGLSGLLGAATGAGFVGAKTAVNPLWKATKESKLAQTLGAIKSRFDGVSFIDDVEQVAAKAGIDLTPEMKSRLSQDPMLKNMAREMSERANTKASKQFQTSVEDYKQKFNTAVLDAIGKTEADLGVKTSVESLGKKSHEYLQKTMGERIKAMREKYKPVYELLDKQAIPASEMEKMTGELAQEAINKKWHIVKGMGEFQEVESAISAFKQAKTFKDFEEILSAEMQSLYKKKMSNVADVIYSVARKYEESAQRLSLDMLEQAQKLPHLKGFEAAAKISADEVQAVKALHSEARAAYREIMEDIRPLSKRLGIFRMSTNPEKFIKALSQIDSKLVGQRLLQDRSELYSLLSERFPELAKTVKQGHLESLPLKKDANGLLDVKSFFKNLRNMTPEKQQFVLSKETQEKLGALGELFDRMGKTKEVRQLDSAMQYIPGGAAALTSLLISGNPVHAAMYFALGQGVKKAATEIPDALRLSMLKMLASNQPISGKGFKSMFDFAASIYKGAQKQQKALSNLFEPGAAVLSSSMAPTAKSLGILERTIMSAETNPEQLFDKEDDLGYYMQDQSMHASALSGRAVTYLNSLRPKSKLLGPLDMEAPPSAMEKAKYNRALAIAEQPLIVLQSIKDGLLTPDDVKTISTIYPSLYEGLKQSIIEKIVDAKTKGLDIPYKMRTNLSLFLGQPVESSTNVTNIATNQAVMLPAQQKQPTPQIKSSFSKLPNIYATPGQLRERNRNK